MCYAYYRTLVYSFHGERFFREKYKKNEMIKQLQPFYWLCERIFYKFELNRTVINIVYNYA